MELWEISSQELQKIKDSWGMSDWPDSDFFSVYYDEPDFYELSHEDIDEASLTEEEYRFLLLLRSVNKG